MYKPVIILYLVCFGFYLLFCRQPDYLDGQFSPATIHFRVDSATNNLHPYAHYTYGVKKYLVSAAYPLRFLQENQKVTVIYETNNPTKGAVYAVWGYWLQIGELLFSIIGILFFYQIAVAITQNPSPESLIEQLETKNPAKKRKYND